MAKKLGVYLMTALFLSTAFSQTSKADPSDVFPKGPYLATLISEAILTPSMLGVKAGQPVADVSGVLMPNGKLRAYVFGQNKGIEIWESADGKVFTRIGNAFGSDNGHGQPRVIKLSDGRYRMFNMSSQGISCSISSDGISFTVENEGCLKKSDYGITGNMAGPGIIKVAGGYRAYFSSLGSAGTGPDPQQIFSATSADSLVWKADTGVRIGKGSAIDQSGEHPTAITHADGSVTIFYFDNGANPPSSPRSEYGLYYATSTDGLIFSNPIHLDLTGLAPKFRYATGNDPDLFLDKDGIMTMWGGDFDHEIGGYIFSVKLTHTDVAPKVSSVKPTPTPTQPVGPSPLVTPPAVKPTEPPTPTPTPSATPTPTQKTTETSVVKKITISCIKGKTIKKVTAVDPKCPNGYKKRT